MAKKDKNIQKDQAEEIKAEEIKAEGRSEKAESEQVNEQTEQEEKQETKPKRKARKNRQDDELEELKIKHAELNDKFLRLFSEFDNFRKRTNKEKADLYKTASEVVIAELLPVIDDFERALKAMEDHKESEESLREGVGLIYNKLKNVLKNKGLEPIESKGEVFDTDFHEAVTQFPAPEEEMKGKVIDEVEKGYTLNGKVIRYSKVVVGT